MALILDTGPLYAALDRSDQDHAACRALLEGATERLIVPAPVLVEVEHFVRTRLNVGVWNALLDDVTAGAIGVEDLTLDDYRRVRDVCDMYADLGIGFVDASVLAVTERRNEPKLATLDHRHFRTVRPRHVESLRLLPGDEA